MRNWVGWIVDNVRDVYLVTFFHASYWSAGVGTFIQAPAHASHWLEDFASCMPTTEGNYPYIATRSQ